MAKANPRPVKKRPNTRWFKGKCSNCKSKERKVTKVSNGQVCEACLGGVLYKEK